MAKINYYGDDSDALQLCPGCTQDNITDTMRMTIKEWIDNNLRPENSGGFEESESITEYHDIKKENTKSIISKKFPIIQVISITDNAQDSNNNTELNSGNYLIDYETGIIQLLQYSLAGTSWIYKFTVGAGSVKLVYKHGFTTVPSIISKIGTLMMAKWIKISDSQVDADGLKSVKIGNYSESYDLQFLGIKSEFDSELNSLINKAKRMYANG